MNSEASILIELIDKTFFWTIEILSFAILARALLSWISPRSGNNAIFHFIYKITEPVLGPIRQVLHKYLNYRSRIDIFPIIAIVLLQLLRALLT